MASCQVKPSQSPTPAQLGLYGQQNLHVCTTVLIRVCTSYEPGIHETPNLWVSSAPMVELDSKQVLMGAVLSSGRIQLLMESEQSSWSTTGLPETF